MKDYEIVCTYLNACAGAAYPQRSFEEVSLADPADYILAKHGKDAQKFQKQVQPDGRIIYAYRDAVTYIYEFTEV